MTVAQYVERVRVALGDLPPKVRDELLDDLPEHLTEVAAESDEPLEARLGPPERYAAELRATVDLAGARIPVRARLASAHATVRARLRPWDVKIGQTMGYGSASALFGQLQPGWWALRGYLAVMFFAYLISQGPSLGLLPRLGEQDLLGWALLVLFVLGSMWLGRRQARMSSVPRGAIALAGVVLAVLGVVGIATADARWRTAGFTVVDNPGASYQQVQDVFVYDRDGRLVPDAMLFDQDGQPVVIGDVYRCNYDPRANRYPRCPQMSTIRSGPSAPGVVDRSPSPGTATSPAGPPTPSAGPPIPPPSSPPPSGPPR